MEKRFATETISDPVKKGLLYDFFKLNEHNTDVKTELLAGFTIFATMGYILFLIPKILSGAGMPVDQTLTALILMVAITTTAMGLYTNRPFVVFSQLHLYKAKEFHGP